MHVRAGRVPRVPRVGDQLPLGDLLADLRHLADRDGYDYGLADARAESYHADETKQQASGSWSARVQEVGSDTRR